MSKLCNFFCGLPGLVHAADSALKEAETGLFGSQPVPNPEPQYNAHDLGAVRLVRTASKAFACGAEEKCGCFGNFSVLVKPFLGLQCSSQTIQGCNLTFCLLLYR